MLALLVLLICWVLLSKLLVVHLLLSLLWVEALLTVLVARLLPGLPLVCPWLPLIRLLLLLPLIVPWWSLVLSPLLLLLALRCQPLLWCELVWAIFG